MILGYDTISRFNEAHFSVLTSLVNKEQIVNKGLITDQGVQHGTLIKMEILQFYYFDLSLLTISLKIYARTII